MVKIQKAIWLSREDIKLIEEKIKAHGLEGKGKWERFLEKIARNRIVFIECKGKFKISVEHIE